MSSSNVNVLMLFRLQHFNIWLDYYLKLDGMGQTRENILLRIKIFFLKLFEIKSSDYYNKFNISSVTLLCYYIFLFNFFYLYE